MYWAIGVAFVVVLGAIYWFVSSKKIDREMLGSQVRYLIRHNTPGFTATQMAGRVSKPLAKVEQALQDQVDLGVLRTEESPDGKRYFDSHAPAAKSQRDEEPASSGALTSSPNFQRLKEVLVQHGAPAAQVTESASMAQLGFDGLDCVEVAMAGGRGVPKAARRPGTCHSRRPSRALGERSAAHRRRCALNVEAVAKTRMNFSA
ncbi:MAG: hypothetical protein AB8H86_17055 [Polyangiales bacterium]